MSTTTKISTPEDNPILLHLAYVLGPGIVPAVMTTSARGKIEITADLDTLPSHALGHVSIPVTPRLADDLAEFLRLAGHLPKPEPTKTPPNPIRIITQGLLQGLGFAAIGYLIGEAIKALFLAP